MHTRRLIAFLLGVWFALVGTIGVVTAVGQRLDSGAAKPAAAEVSRILFESFGLVEVALLFAILCLLFLQNYSRAATILAGVVLLLAVASHFLLTPDVVAYGRILDFRAANEAATERARFANLQRMFGILAVLRLAGSGGVTGILLHRRRESRTRRRSDKVDTVNHAENSHVDR
jgi:hypothetical protein